MLGIILAIWNILKLVCLATLFYLLVTCDSNRLEKERAVSPYLKPSHTVEQK